MVEHVEMSRCPLRRCPTFAMQQGQTAIVTVATVSLPLPGVGGDFRAEYGDEVWTETLVPTRGVAALATRLATVLPHGREWCAAWWALYRQIAQVHGAGQGTPHHLTLLRHATPRETHPLLVFCAAVARALGRTPDPRPPSPTGRSRRGRFLFPGGTESP